MADPSKNDAPPIQPPGQAPVDNLPQSPDEQTKEVQRYLTKRTQAFAEQEKQYQQQLQERDRQLQELATYKNVLEGMLYDPRYSQLVNAFLQGEAPPESEPSSGQEPSPAEEPKSSSGLTEEQVRRMIDEKARVMAQEMVPFIQMAHKQNADSELRTLTEKFPWAAEYKDEMLKRIQSNSNLSMEDALVLAARDRLITEAKNRGKEEGIREGRLQQAEPVTGAMGPGFDEESELAKISRAVQSGKLTREDAAKRAMFEALKKHDLT